MLFSFAESELAFADHSQKANWLSPIIHRKRIGFRRSFAESELAFADP